MAKGRLGRMGRGVGRVAWRIVRIYVVVCLVLALFQSRLIFVGAATQGKAESQVSPPAGAELVRLRGSRGTEIMGVFGRARGASGGVEEAWGKRPTVLWFYGNAMCMNDALEDMEMFRAAGANVMLVDYAGYGMSGGSASEQGCYEAAEAGYHYLLQRGDLDRSKIVAAGWSLGGAVAIDLAARHAGEGHVCGVMVFSAFTSMAEVGQYHYPFMPVGLLLMHRFDSIDKVGRVGVPVLIVHGVRDSIVPFGMSERLAKAAKAGGSAVTRVVVEGADHNDLFEVGGEEVRGAVRGFLGRVEGKGGG